MKANILMIMLAACVLAVATPAHADPSNRTCTVEEVAAYPDRVHIRCGLGGISYYVAVEASSPLATQALILATRTLSTPDHQIDVVLETETSANPPGCLATDCRRLLGIRATP